MGGYSDRIQNLIQGKERMLIAGGRMGSQSGQRFSNVDPATENEICEMSLATGKDVELAGNAAVASFVEWRRVASFERTQNVPALANTLR